MTTFPDSHHEFLDLPIASLTRVGADGAVMIEPRNIHVVGMHR